MTRHRASRGAFGSGFDLTCMCTTPQNPLSNHPVYTRHCLYRGQGQDPAGRRFRASSWREEGCRTAGQSSTALAEARRRQSGCQDTRRTVLSAVIPNHKQFGTHFVFVLIQNLQNVLCAKCIFPFSRLKSDHRIIDLLLTQYTVVELRMGVDAVLKSV
jgi:hypothetical protein